MSDSDLEMLAQATTGHPGDPLDNPPPSALNYLAALDLSEDDLELLLGDVPGLSFADVEGNAEALFFRLRQRIANLVCSDDKLKESVKKSVNAGAEAAWISLLAVLGLTPGVIAAAALKPLAAGLVVAGVEQLCHTPTPSDEHGLPSV